MNIVKIFIDITLALQIYLISMFYSIVFSGLKYKKNVVIINYVVAFIVSKISTTLFEHVSVLPFLSLCIMFALTFNYKATILLRVLYAFCSMAIFSVSEIIAGMGLAMISGLTVEESQRNLVIYLSGYLICVLTAFIIVKIISIIFVSRAPHSNKFSLLVLLYPLSSLAISFLIVQFAFRSSNDLVKVSTVVSMFIFILANIFIFKIIEDQTAYELSNQKMAFVEMQLTAQISHYKEMSEAQKEVRNIRHDIKNNLIALNGLINKENVSEAKDYIDKLTGEIEASSDVVDTGLPAIDAILTTKIKRAKTVKAHIDYKILLDGLMNIDQMDISIIIASALDNAIEAVKQCDVSNRRILLNMASFIDYISIKVENPINKPMEKDFLVTSKNDKLNHGYGLKTIERIALKYNGDLDIDCSDKYFILMVLLKNQ